MCSIFGRFISVERDYIEIIHRVIRCRCVTIPVDTQFGYLTAVASASPNHLQRHLLPDSGSQRGSNRTGSTSRTASIATGRNAHPFVNDGVPRRGRPEGGRVSSRLRLGGGKPVIGPYSHPELFVGRSMGQEGAIARIHIKVIGVARIIGLPFRIINNLTISSSGGCGSVIRNVCSLGKRHRKIIKV